jgi:hypothetical protein
LLHINFALPYFTRRAFVPYYHQIPDNKRLFNCDFKGYFLFSFLNGWCKEILQKLEMSFGYINCYPSNNTEEQGT